MEPFIIKRAATYRHISACSLKTRALLSSCEPSNKLSRKTPRLKFVVTCHMLKQRIRASRSPHVYTSWCDPIIPPLPPTPPPIVVRALQAKKTYQNTPKKNTKGVVLPHKRGTPMCLSIKPSSMSTITSLPSLFYLTKWINSFFFSLFIYLFWLQI